MQLADEGLQLLLAAADDREGGTLLIECKGRGGTDARCT